MEYPGEVVGEIIGSNDDRGGIDGKLQNGAPDDIDVMRVLVVLCEQMINVGIVHNEMADIKVQ